MRTILFPAVLAALLTVSTHAQEPMCGTSPELDARLDALHARPRDGVSAFAQSTSTLRDGAFYLPADEEILPGYRPFDLAGQSLVFTPHGASFSMQKTTRTYVQPPHEARVREFQHDRSGDPWYAIAYDLPTTFPIFGRNISRIYITAFNEIRFDPPSYEQTAMQFTAADALVQPQAVISPLVMTNTRPRDVEYPDVYVEMSDNGVRVTWISSEINDVAFTYIVQAELRYDGTIVFSYPWMPDIRWGAPLISRGYDASAREAVSSVSDPVDVTSSSVPEALRAMLDMQSVQTFRIANSDVFSIRMTLAAAPDATKLAAGETLRYFFVAERDTATVDISRDGVFVTGFDSLNPARNGITAKVNGDTIELFGVQRNAGAQSIVSVRAQTFLLPQSRIIDTTGTLQTKLTAAPRRTSVDLSTTASDAEIALPIVETFVLAPLDVDAVWDRLQAEQTLSNYDVDGLAIYQSFYTDVIFYAGAYSTRGNPSVDGIAPGTPPFRQIDPRYPALLHMNQLTYNYNATEPGASKVLLHEFGHRWLYFISIAENGTATRSLNPTSAHPAAYVHTPSAFPVYGESESSVMGGAYFAQQSDGSYKAHAANLGYSWTDLYLMGLAAPGEVPNWFYLAGTTLPTEYWPEEGAVVTNPNRRDVSINQVLDAHGPRLPTHETSQRKFRLLFALITEPGVAPTAEEIATVNSLRALAERNFALATGGRGRLVTTFVKVPKTRVVR